MKTNFEMVKEFHKAFLKNDPETPIDITKETPELLSMVKLRKNLIEEEYNEVMYELTEVDSIEHIAKELVDLLYVVYGTGSEFGIDLDKCFAEVHRSNMSKLGDDGKPVVREDGKFLKSDRYEKPNLKRILNV